jgi:hypothetical protein
MSFEIEFKDPAMMPRASYRRHPVEDIEPEAEPQVNASDARTAITLILSRVVESNEPELEAKIMAMAVGITFAEASQTELGVRFGVSRQDISKRIREFQDELEIACTGWNKRVSSRDNYRRSNIRRRKMEAV